jgi:hypothetical protein
MTDPSLEIDRIRVDAFRPDFSAEIQATTPLGQYVHRRASMHGQDVAATVLRVALGEVWDVSPAINSLPDEWAFGWLPEVQRILKRERMVSQALSRQSMAQLLAQFERTWDAWLRLHEIAWLVRIPASQAIQMLVNAVHQLGDPTLNPEHLLGGFVTTQTQADIANQWC